MSININNSKQMDYISYGFLASKTLSALNSFSAGNTLTDDQQYILQDAKSFLETVVGDGDLSSTFSSGFSINSSLSALDVMLDPISKLQELAGTDKNMSTELKNYVLMFEKVERGEKDIAREPVYQRCTQLFNLLYSSLSKNIKHGDGKISIFQMA